MSFSSVLRFSLMWSLYYTATMTSSLTCKSWPSMPPSRTTLIPPSVCLSKTCRGASMVFPMEVPPSALCYLLLFWNKPHNALGLSFPAHAMLTVHLLMHKIHARRSCRAQCNVFTCGTMTISGVSNQAFPPACPQGPSDSFMSSSAATRCDR